MLIVLFSCSYWVAFSSMFADWLSSLAKPLQNVGMDRLKLISLDSFLKYPSSSDVVPSTDMILHPSKSTCAHGTFGLFPRVFVVSLPQRSDRREDMEMLRRTLSLNWTWVDATSANDPVVTAILDEVELLRAQTNPSSSESRASFDWPDDFSAGSREFPQTLQAHDLTSSTAKSLSGSQNTATSLPSAAPSDAVISLSIHPDDVKPPLTCANRNFISGPPYTPSLPSYMHLTRAKIACWYSHMEVIEAIGSDVGVDDECGDVALVLEDDIDMEKDIKERLHALWPSLPPQWDVVFLGHCWSNETYHPPLVTVTDPSSGIQTSLHPSYAPKCTHAYALSQAGARRLLSHLQFPPFAYSRALDQAISWLVLTGRLKSFSVVPSVVVQRKVRGSDVDAGREGLGSEWRDSLTNGVLGV
ncbi:hypothetical protein EIP91_010369 [Steccherinum ochraceum]|uniref:Glycosyltransferase family 25 protein n=1 Tax=Steccherinum ochraceum TaxID=92696 RepID=A0A4R0RJJ6_9APHY|nr:hypothetical protein EIP91_010369 [Steccherinum ochraceum]